LIANQLDQPSDENRDRLVMMLVTRQKFCRKHRRDGIAYLLLILTAIILGRCRHPSSKGGLFNFVFVTSFLSKCPQRQHAPSSLSHFNVLDEKSPVSTRYDKILSIKRLGSTTDGARDIGCESMQALASPSLSPKPKTPAPTDWVVVEEYPMVPLNGIDPYRILDNNTFQSSSDDRNENDFDETARSKYLEALSRLNITQHNLTLPIAIMSLDPHRYPSLSKARKACRQKKIVLRSSPESMSKAIFPSAYRKGMVGDRVYPLDCIARRELYQNLKTKISSTSYETLGHNFVKSKFQNLPVVYEDDYMALVVKPAGLLVHPEGKNGGWGRKNNVLNALPYFLRKPTVLAGKTASTENDTEDSNMILDRPIPVHRLDFATSGLLVAAKTKGASRLLAGEFEHRKAQKTYTALVYGIPIHKNDDKSTAIPSFYSSRDDNGDVSKVEKSVITTTDGVEGATASNVTRDDWNNANCFLNNKLALTRWRILGSHNCSVQIRYLNNTEEKGNISDVIHVPVSIIEMKPKTGRYHQLRRTMAWLYNTPILGDPIYSNNYIEDNFLPENAELVEQNFYRRSLMLCSNKIDIAHPFYNTLSGRREWKTRNQEFREAQAKTESDFSSSLYETQEGLVRVTASIQLPKKFIKFIDMMERTRKLSVSKKME